MFYTNQKWDSLKFVLVLLVLKVGCHETAAGQRFHQSDAEDLSAWLSGREPLGQGDRSATWCQYRDVPIPYNSDVFRLQSSFGCYSYTAPSRFKPDVGRYDAGVNTTDGLTYQLVVVDGVKYNVDYRDEASVTLISKSLLTAADTRKWIECSKAAGKCCEFMLDNPNTVGDCPNTWDGWYCWHRAASSTVQYGVCPDYIYSGSPPACHHPSSKECFPNATWDAITNYAKCDITPRIKNRTVYHVIMLGVSLGMSLPAIVIFFSYRKLRNDMRVVLTRNLLIAISVRNLLTIVSKTTIILDAITVTDEADSVMAQNGLGCKILASLEKLATNSVFACMLLLGFYLHRLFAIFRGRPKMWIFFIAAAVVCTVPVFAWAIVAALLNNQYCWTVDENGYQWINDAVKIAMLAVNMVLIADIIRVLLTKVALSDKTDSQNTRRTTKVAIFLLPLFGVQFVFTAARPDTTSCTGEQVFYYFSYGFDGLQGAVVSLFFCYLNTEVRSLVVKTARNMKDKVLMWMDKNYVPRSSKSQGDPRKITMTTIVETPRRSASPPLQNYGQPGEFSSGNQSTPQERFHSPLGSLSDPYDIPEGNFFTPPGSEVGSPPSDSQLYYSPRSSLAGATGDADVDFYECIDDDSEQEASRRLERPGTRTGSFGSGFVEAAEQFNDNFRGASFPYSPENSRVDFVPPDLSQGRPAYDNRAFSVSSEKLPDRTETALRKRNASTERNDETEV